MRSSVGLVCLASVLVFGCWVCGPRSTTIPPVKAGGQAVSANAPKVGQVAVPVAPQVQNPPPGSFDWAGFPETGGGEYTPLPPAQFDPNDHSGDDVVTSKYPADSPNRPAANEDGSAPQIETDSDGNQWAVYTTRTPNKGSVSIDSLTLHPTKINGKPAIFGGVTVTNLTSYNIVGLQLVYVSGNTKTTVLTADRASTMIRDGIKSHTGLAIQVKSIVADEDRAVPALLLEAQIDGPPGLLTDQAELREVLVNTAGQVVGPPGERY
jgi:hypothetical protein